MEQFIRASEIFSDNMKQFQKASALYKSMLDKNFGERFCIGEHCREILQVEIRLDGGNWGATPKAFYEEETAKQEIEYLKTKYSFVREFRIVSRKEKD